MLLIIVGLGSVVAPRSWRPVVRPVSEVSATAEQPGTPDPREVIREIP
jgi:hypothetical protein